MKKLTYIIVISFLISLLNTNAQEVAPLQLGNYWIYDAGPNTELGKITVIDTMTIIETIAYCKLEGTSVDHTILWYAYGRLREDGFYVTRRDTSYPAPNHEKLYWKKDAIVGDTWENPTTAFPLVYSVLDQFVAPIFGNNYTIKHLEIDGGLVLFDEYWTEEFGKLSRSDYGGLLSSLRGCVIDGVAYGDTSFMPVSVEDEFKTLNKFKLEQNYPNPFNPSTTIKFELLEQSFASLKVFDLLGNEVAMFVNEEKPAGTYQITFDGSGLASGTYFYQLKTANSIETKKMQLMK